MKTFLDIAMLVVVFLMMGVVGLDLVGADFRSVARRPGIVVASTLGQSVLLPSIAVLILRLLHLPPAIQAGVLLIAACPCGGISNYYTHLAHASPALSVVLTSVSCMAAAVTMPLVMHAYRLCLNQDLSFRPPVGRLVTQLVLTVVFPIVLGMLVRRAKPALITRHGSWFRGLSMLALAGFVGLVLVQEWQRISTGMWGIIPTAALLNLLGFGAGYAVGVACRCSVADRFTLAVEFAVRNVVIAAVIAITILGQVEFAIFATAYFLIEVPMMLIAVAAFRLVSDRSQTTTTRMTVVEVEAEAP